MKKVALVFVLAVFVPSLVLAWLAVRSLRDQQFVLERQQTLLYQNVTDSFAKEINDYLADQQREFNGLVQKLLADSDPRAAAAGFDERLRQNWPQAEVGFVVTLSGDLLCPSPATRPETRLFCLDNGGFLANRESVEVYWNDFSKGGNLAGTRNTIPQQEPVLPLSPSQSISNSTEQVIAQSGNYLNVGKAQARKVNPAQQGGQLAAMNEKVLQEQNVSKLVPAEAEFRQLIGDASDGMLARILQNKLKLMFWHRLEKDPQLVFGAQLNQDQVTGRIREMVRGKTKTKSHVVPRPYRNSLPNDFLVKTPPVLLPEEICLVVLDENARPVASSDGMWTSLLPTSDSAPQWILQSDASFRNRHKTDLILQPDASFRNQFKTDLKHPFVATEIGEALPHWEVAAYLRSPDSLRQTARSIQLTLGLLILVLVIAIGVGGWLIARELNRQLTLARQKTDFVSNVSHELKTPLTSIRMFSELLAEGRVNEPAKQRSYLNIITSETARLTRLINNVLDFSRMERGEKKYTFARCDLCAVVRETAETYRPHLESNGFRFACELPESPVFVNGDRDALAQIIVNLLSNAEKYSNGRNEIDLKVERRREPLAHVNVRVMDRGMGVPRGCEEKIFEQFYRAHDSINSGIQGSGLGLTLARQIARAHGGDVVYEPREGDGSCFILRLPTCSES